MESELHTKTEDPYDPNSLYSPFKSTASDVQDATGTTAYAIELKNQGKLGLFFPRQQTISKAVPFYINVNSFYSSIKHTLQEAPDHLSDSNTKHLSHIDSLSSSLASGCKPTLES